jgi:hypothetical protein
MQSAAWPGARIDTGHLDTNCLVTNMFDWLFAAAGHEGGRGVAAC